MSLFEQKRLILYVIHDTSPYSHWKVELLLFQEMHSYFSL